MALRSVTAAARCCRVLPVPLSSTRVGMPAVQAALISGKTMRGAPKTWKKEAWPYKEKSFRGWKTFFDKATSRWDENSKIIVVDGPPTTGKDALARALAEEFEMQYMPPVSGELVYTNDYGFDRRQLNDQLPWNARMVDLSDFLKNPYDKRMASFQLHWFEYRFSQYVDTLAHLLNTGQGIVLNRSVWSDKVYMEAMCKAGFVSRAARDKYREIYKNCLDDKELTPRPHLVIYLDLPPEDVKKRIAARKLPDEANSPAVCDAFLTALDEQYRAFIDEIGIHSEILSYDMREDVPHEFIVDDIEKVDFDHYQVLDVEGTNKANLKMMDWRKTDHGSTEDYWNKLRTMVTNYKFQLLGRMQVPVFEVPELLMSQEDAKLYDEIVRMGEETGQRYSDGFNPAMGDSVWFKLKQRGNYRGTTRY